MYFNLEILWVRRVNFFREFIITLLGVFTSAIFILSELTLSCLDTQQSLRIEVG